MGAAAVAAPWLVRRPLEAAASATPLERVGIQLYSVRSLLAQDFDGKTFDPANPQAYLDSLAIKK